MGSPAGFGVEVGVFDDLRTTYAAILETIGTSRGIVGERSAPPTGSESLTQLLTLLLQHIDAFLVSTSANLTYDRDGLARALDNYRSSDHRSARSSRSLLEQLVDDVLDLLPNIGPQLPPRSPGRLSPVAGPVDRIGAPR
jgi:hypothetical protein